MVQSIPPKPPNYFDSPNAIVTTDYNPIMSGVSDLHGKSRFDEVYYVDQHLLLARRSSIDDEWAKEKCQYANLLIKGAIPYKSKHDGGYIKMYISLLERQCDDLCEVLKENLYRHSKHLYRSLGLHEDETDQQKIYMVPSIISVPDQTTEAIP